MTASPCTHRLVAADGRILCTRIAGADQEVWPDLCDRCPARAIGCACLRFTLARAGGGAILVRQAGGRSYLLEPEPDALHFQRAACAAYGQPITSPASCQGCRSAHPAAARAPAPGATTGARAPAPGATTGARAPAPGATTGARATIIPFPATRSADAVSPDLQAATRQRRALA